METPRSTSAAKAAFSGGGLIAALKRRATQKQGSTTHLNLIPPSVDSRAAHDDHLWHRYRRIFDPEERSELACTERLE